VVKLECHQVTTLFPSDIRTPGGTSILTTKCHGPKNVRPQHASLRRHGGSPSLKAMCCRLQAAGLWYATRRKSDLNDPCAPLRVLGRHTSTATGKMDLSRAPASPDGGQYLSPPPIPNSPPLPFPGVEAGRGDVGLCARRTSKEPAGDAASPQPLFCNLGQAAVFVKIL